MKRSSFDHLILACCRQLEVDEVVVVGSQAFHASVDQMPAIGAMSMEVEIVLPDPDERDDVTSLFGELSPFHESFGVYADPIDDTTSRSPAGWTERLIDVVVVDERRQTSYVARCADPHDLAVAKLLANRDKDRELLRSLLEAGVLDPELVQRRLADTLHSMPEGERCLGFLRRW
jgi:hypothetical protein